MNIKDYMAQLAANVNSYIHYNLPQETGLLTRLFSAMRYSALNGGKRIRPTLVLMFNELFGGESKNALPAAMAIELIHTYSLIHDDLPSLDDGQYRRGKPTNHRVFGEALGLLAGDALLTYAFDILAAHTPKSHLVGTLVRELAKAAGHEGMLGGQVIDIGAAKPIENLEDLKHLHALKTGALICASCRMGILTAEGTPEQLAFATRFGEGIGLLFQIVDDILDVEGDPVLLGKSTGRDSALDKITFVSMLGKDKAREEAELLAQEISKDCENQKAHPRFKQMVEYLLTRQA